MRKHIIALLNLGSEEFNKLNPLTE